jgi:hypothetical protein
MFGRQRKHSLGVLRYWQLVSRPTESLNGVALFLGIAEDQVTMIPPDHARPFSRAWRTSFGAGVRKSHGGGGC